MTDAAASGFDFDQWKSERDAAKAERAGLEARARSRAEQRAQRKVSREWDERIHQLIEERLEVSSEAVGQVIGETVAEARREFEEKLRVSLRIAILEQGGLCPHVRGTWQASETYAALDVVVHDGASWIAKHSNPGVLPGEGWQILCCRGERGRPGERGPQGETGPPGPVGPQGGSITGWSIDAKSFTVGPIFDFGKGGFGPPLDLRQLFVEFQRQTAAEAEATPAATNARQPGIGPTMVRLIDGGKPSAEAITDEPV